MARWIPGIAVFGLLCLMIIPAPGIWGVLIGAFCILAIAVSVLLLLADRAASRVVVWIDRTRARRRRKRRTVHAGSGIARKIR